MSDWRGNRQPWEPDHGVESPPSVTTSAAVNDGRQQLVVSAAEALRLLRLVVADNQTRGVSGDDLERALWDLRGATDLGKGPCDRLVIGRKSPDSGRTIREWEGSR